MSVSAHDGLCLKVGSGLSISLFDQCCFPSKRCPTNHSGMGGGGDLGLSD